MDLHIGYEKIARFQLTRAEAEDTNARGAGKAPTCLLKADRDEGAIRVDSETTLRGVPPEAWNYRLGSRAALDWILDQYKEGKPRDPVVRAKFNSYRLADHKEAVIDLLERITTVSLETIKIVEEMKNAKG